jgi:signal transduction histidine kinase/ligand-binding sensor domain-containing protein/DNA-binding response OmpR family regulator
MLTLPLMAERSRHFYVLPASQSFRAIRAIVRDYKGFMWFGTEDGLVRFDGVNQRLYVHDAERPKSLSYTIVNVLLEDLDHRLWVGTSHGLNLYNRVKDGFDQLPPSSIEKKRLNEAYVSALSIGQDSSLWIGTNDQGLFCLNRSTLRVKRYSLRLKNGTLATITSLLNASNDELWIGTQSGLVVFHPHTGKAVWYRNKAVDQTSISSNNVSTIQRDSDGAIWVGTIDKGIQRVRANRGSYVFERTNPATGQPWLASNSINKILPDGSGNLWIGTENDGLFLMHLKTGSAEVYTHEAGNENSLGSNSIWSLYDDNEGRVWIGSYNKGISVVDPMYSKFENYQMNPYTAKEAVNNDFRGFCSTRNGTIWVATDGAGICRFDPVRRTFHHFILASKRANGLTNNSVQTILCDARDDLWVGTWGGGVDRFSSAGKRIKQYPLETKNGVGNNKLRTLFEDGTGTIWAGTNGSGLFRWNREKDAFEPFAVNDYVDDRAFVTAIHSDHRHRLWVGTLSGLVCVTLDAKNRLQHARRLTASNSKLSANAISSLFLDRTNTLWIGSNSGGLNALNLTSGVFRRYNTKNGLPSDGISGIIEDNAGTLWVSTNAGLARIHRGNGSITTYTTDDGLLSNEFYSKSCFKTAQGDLLFGSNNGLTVVRPGRIPINRRAPRVLLTGLTINNKPVEIDAENSPLKKSLSELDRLRLNYKQSSFSIDFVATNYTRPHRNEFEYKLEGRDDEWIRIGHQNTVYFTKVKPGKYTLKIRAANNDGVWNAVPTALRIQVTPPLWQTTVAYLLYLLLLFWVIRFIVNAWNERIHLKNQWELEKMAKQKEHELNVKNLDFFTHISHEFRTPLSLIIAPIDSLLQSAPASMREQMEVIQRNAQRLLTLTNDLLDLRKLEDGGMQLRMEAVDVRSVTEAIVAYFTVQVKERQLRLEVSYPEKEVVCVLDTEKYHTIVFNLLSNALKYTPFGGTVQIHLSRTGDGQCLAFQIRNTGEGIQPSELPFVFDKFYQAGSTQPHQQFGTGIGLALVRSLVELHGGTIDVVSDPMKDTTFTFTLPLMPSSPSEVKVAPGQRDGERPLLLIVEDNRDLQVFLKKELTAHYDVVLAENGAEGLDKANELTPDLVISDVVMPKMNGFELCERIKSDVRTSHIPVVLLTAKATTDDHIQGLETGADAYLTKPFNLKLLKTQVANLLQSRKELYTLFSNDKPAVSRTQSGNSMDQAFLQSSMDYILENITDNELSIEGLAGFHHMSHRTYYRKIKALTGYTVVEFVKIVRLKEALKLMHSTQYSLSEISYMTGFTSPSYFTKNFREFYGKPPSDYLK